MARDLFHDAVRHALEKDGWTITADPLKLEFGTVKALVDLGAEKIIAAERGLQQIAVEIKSFIGPSEINDFHTALGQFLNYRKLLDLTDPTRELFLAIPLETQISFFSTDFPKMMIEDYNVKTLVYDPTAEVIVQWK